MCHQLIYSLFVDKHLFEINQFQFWEEDSIFEWYTFLQISNDFKKNFNLRYILKTSLNKWKPGDEKWSLLREKKYEFSYFNSLLALFKKTTQIKWKLNFKCRKLYCSFICFHSKLRMMSLVSGTTRSDITPNIINSQWRLFVISTWVKVYNLPHVQQLLNFMVIVGEIDPLRDVPSTCWPIKF